MKPAEFADLFRACRDGREWAVANCATMDDAWAKARPEWLIWIATRQGVLDDTTLVRFAEWSGFAWNRDGVMPPREIALRACWSALGKSVIETAGDRSWSDEMASKIKANRSSVYASQAAWLRANAKPDWERARQMGGCAMSEIYGTFSKAYVEAMRLRLSALEPENKGLAARVAELEERCKRLEEAGDAHMEWVPASFQGAWRAAKEAKP